MFDTALDDGRARRIDSFCDKNAEGSYTMKRTYDALKSEHDWAVAVWPPFVIDAFFGALTVNEHRIDSKKHLLGNTIAEERQLYDSLVKTLVNIGLVTTSTRIVPPWKQNVAAYELTWALHPQYRACYDLQQRLPTDGSAGSMDYNCLVDLMKALLKLPSTVTQRQKNDAITWVIRAKRYARADYWIPAKYDIMASIAQLIWALVYQLSLNPTSALGKAGCSACASVPTCTLEYWEIRSKISGWEVWYYLVNILFAPAITVLGGYALGLWWGSYCASIHEKLMYAGLNSFKFQAQVKMSVYNNVGGAADWVPMQYQGVMPNNIYEAGWTHITPETVLRYDAIATENGWLGPREFNGPLWWTAVVQIFAIPLLSNVVLGTGLWALFGELLPATRVCHYKCNEPTSDHITERHAFRELAFKTKSDDICNSQPSSTIVLGITYMDTEEVELLGEASQHVEIVWVE